MKKYDRENRKWITEEEYNRKCKVRKLCKGNKDHDYILVLPWGVSYNENYKHDAQVYYDAEQEVKDFKKKIYHKLYKKGIIARNSMCSPSYMDSHKNYKCVICFKEKW